MRGESNEKENKKAVSYGKYSVCHEPCGVCLWRQKLEQIDAVETAPTQQPEESGETPSEEKASTLESFTENTFEKMGRQQSESGRKY